MGEGHALSLVGNRLDSLYCYSWTHVTGEVLSELLALSADDLCPCSPWGSPC